MVFMQLRRLCTGRESPLKGLLQNAAQYGEQGGNWATAPYSDAPPSPGPLPRADPREAAVLLFPGQGAQYPGMGRHLMRLPAVRDLYSLASAVVGWDVARVCLEGPADELARRCQTCILVTSLAALEAAREARPGAMDAVRAAAGFSLGEITALVYAGALQLEQALRLVELRTEAMAAAAALRPGGLLTAWLAPASRLWEALAEARAHAELKGVPEPVCDVANYLYPGCRALAGDELALRWLETEGARFGIKRTARVRVAGAVHSGLMAPAKEALAEALRDVAVSAPRVRVLSAENARPHAAGRLRSALARHVVAPVRWEQTLAALYTRPGAEHFPLTLALGPGDVLRATLRKVNAKAWDRSILIGV